MGRDAAYYGDHVELSDNRSDFASTVGIGGVIGTKFTWPADADPEGRHVLTEEKEALITKWMSIYKSLMLPKGEYRGELYDIGFDVPEAHAIQKGESMYYAFYSDSFEGDLDLRGLDESMNYELLNYETGESIGTVGKSSNVTIQAQIDHHLLIEAKPISSI
jgi:alpha-galactosidase